MKRAMAVVWASALGMLGACNSGGNGAAQVPLKLDDPQARVAIQDEQEPNNTVEEANRLNATESLFGSVAPGTDVIDYFAFELSEARRYRFVVVPTGGDVGFAINDMTAKMRYVSLNGELVVDLAKDRMYVLEVASDDTGAVEQTYEIELFRAAEDSPATPPDRCETEGSSGDQRQCP